MTFEQWFESLDLYYDPVYESLFKSAYDAGQKEEREACRQIALDLTDKDMQAVDVLCAIEAKGEE